MEQFSRDKVRYIFESEFDRLQSNDKSLEVIEVKKSDLKVQTKKLIDEGEAGHLMHCIKMESFFDVEDIFMAKMADNMRIYASMVSRIMEVLGFDVGVDSDNPTKLVYVPPKAVEPEVDFREDNLEFNKQLKELDEELSPDEEASNEVDDVGGDEGEVADKE